MSISLHALVLCGMVEMCVHKGPGSHVWREGATGDREMACVVDLSMTVSVQKTAAFMQLLMKCQSVVGDPARADGQLPLAWQLISRMFQNSAGSANSQHRGNARVVTLRAEQLFVVAEGCVCSM